MPDHRSKSRCMWYNDRGWPRINPVLERRFVDPPVGCDLGSACRFVHPNDADWKSSRSFRIPPPHLYSTGVRPETPDPYLRRHSSPVRKSSIKLEPHSPVIPLDESGSATNLKYRNSRSRSRDRSLTTRIGLDKGRSPPRGPRKESRYSRERRGPSSEPRSPTLVRGRSPRQDHRRSHSRDTYNSERAEKPDLLDRIAMDVDEKSARFNKGGMRRPEADISPIATTSRPRSALDAPPTSASSQGSFLSATMPLPPPTPTIRQAPTMPRVPSLAPTMNQVELKREELTPEARYKRWSERISLLAEATRAHTKHDKLLSDRNSLETLSTAPRMAALDPDVRKNMENALAELTLKCEEAQREVDETLDRVLKSDFWPVMERRSAAELEGMRDQAVQDSQDRLQAQVVRMSGEIQKLERGLKEVAAWVGSRGRTITATGAAVPAIASPNSPSLAFRRAPEEWERNVPKKRRVGSEDPPAYDSDSLKVQEASTSKIQSVPLQKDDQSTAEEIHRIQKNIRSLDTRLHELEDQGVQTIDDIRTAVNEQVESELDKIQHHLRHEKRQRKELEEQQAVIKDKVSRFDEDISLLVKDIASFVEKTPDIDADRVLFAERYQQLSELAEKMSATIAQQEADKAALSSQLQIALDNNAAVKSALESSTLNAVKRPEPIPPVFITLDSIVESLLPRILDAVRGDLRPVLTEHRSQIVQTLREHAQSAMLVREKLEKVALVPQALQSLLDREKTNGTHASGLSAASHVGEESTSGPPP